MKTARFLAEKVIRGHRFFLVLRLPMLISFNQCSVVIYLFPSLYYSLHRTVILRNG